MTEATLPAPDVNEKINALKILKETLINVKKKKEELLRILEEEGSPKEKMDKYNEKLKETNENLPMTEKEWDDLVKTVLETENKPEKTESQGEQEKEEVRELSKEEIKKYVKQICQIIKKINIGNRSKYKFFRDALTGKNKIIDKFDEKIVSYEKILYLFLKTMGIKHFEKLKNESGFTEFINAYKDNKSKLFISENFEKLFINEDGFKKHLNYLKKEKEKTIIKAFYILMKLFFLKKISKEDEEWIKEKAGSQGEQEKEETKNKSDEQEAEKALEILTEETTSNRDES